MERKTAMVSSTVVDLPDHRDGVRDACVAASVFPEMMESWPARDQDAIDTSFAMVDRAEIFIGIYAYRYGHVPKDADVSITEMEFDRAEHRAKERELTILPFLMDPAHPVTADMVEADAGARAKLDRLKQRACQGRGRVLFKSAEQLRGQVETALKELTIREQAQRLSDAEQTMVLLRLALDDARAELARKNRELGALKRMLDR